MSNVMDELPPELATALEPLPQLGDEELWGAARRRLPDDVSDELESLHTKQQREGLTKAEGERAELLLLEYDRTMLVRARAALLLRERGYDVACPPRTPVTLSRAVANPQFAVRAWPLRG